MLAGGTETTRAALAVVERFDDVELDLHHRHDQELRDALHRIHHEGLAPAVPARDEHLPLVVRVDEPDEVAEHDPVLVAEPRSRNQDGRATRVAEMNRNARGYERGYARAQRQRRVDASADVEARGSGSGVRGKLGTDPFVEDPDVELVQD